MPDLRGGHGVCHSLLHCARRRWRLCFQRSRATAKQKSQPHGDDTWEGQVPTHTWLGQRHGGGSSEPAVFSNPTGTPHAGRLSSPSILERACLWEALVGEPPKSEETRKGSLGLKSICARLDSELPLLQGAPTLAFSAFLGSSRSSPPSGLSQEPVIISSAPGYKWPSALSWEPCVLSGVKVLSQRDAP